MTQNASPYQITYTAVAPAHFRGQSLIYFFFGGGAEKTDLMFRGDPPKKGKKVLTTLYTTVARNHFDRTICPSP